MDTLYLVMPAYNEEANIEEAVSSWYKVLSLTSPDSKLIVADSGSKDNTHAILEKMKETAYPQLEILSDTNQYHGPKLIAMYNYAIEHGADYIFQTDSDGQTNPDEFEQFWNLRNEHDAIIGNRVVRGDGNDRKFVENVVCFLLRIYFGVKVQDANAPFRLMKTETVAKYINKLPVDYNIPNIMFTTYFAYYKENIKFIEISFKPRQGGENSINIPNIVKIGWNALGDFHRLKKDM